jgi:hypothetical protein
MTETWLLSARASPGAAMTATRATATARVLRVLELMLNGIRSPLTARFKGTLAAANSLDEP